MAHERVAAIVPAYNEEETVGNVVRALKQSDLINEVIVISDGSTDDTEKIAREAGATTHQFPKSRGKGGALVHAVTHTDAAIVVFFDADLIGLEAKHAELLLSPVLSGDRIMNVGIRDRGVIATWISHHLPLVSGERAMRRQVFERIPSKYLQGFMVEIALNYYCRSRKHEYGAVTLPGVTIVKKYQKVGYFKGMLQYVSMWFEVAWGMILIRTARLRGEF